MRSGSSHKADLCFRLPTLVQEDLQMSELEGRTSVCVLMVFEAHEPRTQHSHAGLNIARGL